MRWILLPLSLSLTFLGFLLKDKQALAVQLLTVGEQQIFAVIQWSLRHLWGMISGVSYFGCSADLGSHSKCSLRPFWSTDLGVVLVWEGLPVSLKAYVAVQQGKHRWVHSSWGRGGCRGSPADPEQLPQLQPHQPQAGTALRVKARPAPSPQCPGLRTPKQKQTGWLLWLWLSQCRLQAVYPWA